MSLPPISTRPGAHAVPHQLPVIPGQPSTGEPAAPAWPDKSRLLASRDYAALADAVARFPDPILKLGADDPRLHSLEQFGIPHGIVVEKGFDPVKVANHLKSGTAVALAFAEGSLNAESVGAAADLVAGLQSPGSVTQRVVRQVTIARVFADVSPILQALVRSQARIEEIRLSADLSVKGTQLAPSDAAALIARDGLERIEVFPEAGTDIPHPGTPVSSWLAGGVPTAHAGETRELVLVNVDPSLQEGLAGNENLDVKVIVSAPKAQQPSPGTLEPGPAIEIATYQLAVLAMSKI